MRRFCSHSQVRMAMLVSSEASPARPDLDVASKPPCYWCRHSSAPPKDCVAAEASASRLDAVLDLERAQGVERRRLPGPGGVDTVQRLPAPARDAERHDRPDMAPPMRERFRCGRLQSDRRARSVRPRKADMASPAGESEERASWRRKRRMGRLFPSGRDRLEMPVQDASPAGRNHGRGTAFTKAVRARRESAGARFW